MAPRRNEGQERNKISLVNIEMTADDPDSYIAGSYDHDQLGQVEDSDTAVVRYSPPDQFTQEQVIALQDELAATKDLLKASRDTNNVLICKYGSESSAHPQVRAVANAFASLQFPDPAMVEAAGVKVQEASLRRLSAQNSSAEAHAHTLKVKIDALSATFTQLNVQAVQTTANDFAPGSMQNNTVNKYYNSGPPDRAAFTRPQRRRRANEPQLPAYRQACTMNKNCKKLKCPFVHSRQRAYFGTKTLNNLKDYVTKDNCGRPEHGGI